MGLDQYLSRRHYVQRWDFIPEEKQFAVTVTRGGKPYAPVKPERISYVTEQVGYWRKANAVHAWFVKNVQDGKDECQESHVSREKLEELLAAVNAVLDGEPPQNVLPTQGDFFFGSTGYDAGYFEDMQTTKNILEPLLAEKDDDTSYYYQASW